ncbi:ribonuclease Z [Candidatus Woesearchaeota archaeon]|nr:ribonuclease Z [Candidatus Woesearchaeota archaeon]
MAIEITMLGTACMVPTKERNVQAIFVDMHGEGILFDCGEGTQRQMNIAGLNRNRVRKIFISHWHGDHVSGLIGLLQTVTNNENPQKVTIFGPRETKDRIGHLMQSVSFESSRLNIEIKELDPVHIEKAYENEEYYVECAYLDHKPRCLGYSLVEKDKLRIQMPKAKKLGLREGPLIGKLQRGQAVEHKGQTIKPEDVATIQKGKKLTIIMDTQPCENAYELAREADLLVCESAYTEEHEEKAREYKHMTTRQAALIATNANVKKLIITHFSQRYKGTKELAEEIKTFFPNSETAYDFMKVKL